MRRSALIAAAVALALGAGPEWAAAHLVVARAGLASVAREADGVLVARVLAPTELDAAGDRARTRFTALAGIAGEVPSGEFIVASAGRAPLRRPRGAVEIVFVRRPMPGAGDWGTSQDAGLGIPLGGAEPSAATLAAVRSVWRVAHPAAPRAAAPADAADEAQAWARALVPALSAPERKLRVLAVLDLAALAHAPSDLDDETVRALSAYGSAPADDAALRPALEAIVAAVRGRSS